MNTLIHLFGWNIMSACGAFAAPWATISAAIVSFSIEHRDANSVKTELAYSGFNVSVSHPSSTLLDAEARRLPPVVRASPHYYNTEEEITRFVEATRAASQGVLSPR
jgi:selenocysteine lyase/cysteine desulfurase